MLTYPQLHELINYVALIYSRSGRPENVLIYIQVVEM